MLYKRPFSSLDTDSYYYTNNTYTNRAYDILVQDNMAYH